MDPIETQQELRDLTDDQLVTMRALAAQEQERRDNLAQIPAQIADLAGKYRDGGGDEQALTDALTPEQVTALEA